MKNKLIFIIALLILLSPGVVKAASCNVVINGPSNVLVGQNVTLTVAINSISDDSEISFVEGYFSFNKNLSLKSYESKAPFDISYNYLNDTNNYIFAGLSYGDGLIKNSSNLFTVTFQATALGSGTFKIDNAVYSTDYSDISCNNPAKTIMINKVLSSNNNLKMITINGQNLANFSSRNLNYNLNLSSNSINIGAVLEDKTATIDGTGTKSLNYGNNQLNLVVTAENGVKKTYNIVINRSQDSTPTIRSNDANLASLSLKNYDLSFNTNNYNYDILVPYEAQTLVISAKTRNSKARVSISGHDRLQVGLNKVNVIVTAEDNTRKIYTINVTRAEDINKKNTYLKEIVPSIGILGPVFNKYINEYIIYLPFHIENISFNTLLETPENAKQIISGPDSLEVGNNKYEIKIASGDNVNIYAVNVKRAVDPLSSNVNNIYLKSLKITKGSLTEEFIMTKQNYFYTGNISEKDITAIPDDKYSEIEIQRIDDDFYIILKAPSGDVGIYHLEKAKEYLLVKILCCIIILGVVYLLYRLIIKSKKERKNGRKS